MKIVVPVEINLDTDGAVQRVLDCISDWYDDDIGEDLGDYSFLVPNEDVIKKNFTIDVLEEALKKVKER